MSVTRRQFLGYATGAVTAGLPWLPLDVTRCGCVLLDLNEGGCFKESVSGFESALTSGGAQWMRADARWMSPARRSARRFGPGTPRRDAGCSTVWARQDANGCERPRPHTSGLCRTLIGCRRAALGGLYFFEVNSG